MQGEPAHLQRLSVEGGAQDTQHARAEACPAKHIYPSDCVGSDVWMAQQVRPTLPDPAYRTDRQQVVNVLRRKSAESIKAGGQSALHLTGRIYACSRNSCELSTRNCPCNPGWVHICDRTSFALSVWVESLEYPQPVFVLVSNNDRWASIATWATPHNASILERL